MIQESKEIKFCQNIRLQPIWMAKWQNIHMNALNLNTTGQKSFPMYVKQLNNYIQLLIK